MWSDLVSCRCFGPGRSKPFLAQAQIDDRFHALGFRGDFLRRAQEPAFKMIIQNSPCIRNKGGQYRFFADLELLKGLKAWKVAEIKTRRALFEKFEADFTVEING